MLGLLTGTKPLRQTLKKGAVPSVFAWNKIKSEAAGERDDRAKKRLKRATVEPGDFDMEVHEEVVAGEESDDQRVEDSPNATTEQSTQTETIATSILNIEKLKYDNKAIQAYTGLEDYRKFVFVLATLGSAVYELNYRWRRTDILSIENQFLITLIKLRKYYSHKELSILFQISEFSVSNIFVTWINFMYCQWRELDIWPSQALVAYFSPLDFNKMFPTTRVIIDGTEIPIKKPGNPITQQKCWSSYKHGSTLKTNVGCSPGGAVTHVQDAYGGSVSDRLMTERSDLMTKCDPGDSIMSDKGFTVQDIFAPYDIAINIPTFMTGKNQLSSMEVLHDRKIASKRVLIERIIGLAKTYKILSSKLNDVEAALGSQINFRACIVPSCR